MASIVSDLNGRKRVQFVASDGSRKTLRLGKASMKQAEAFKVKVEDLVSATITGRRRTRVRTRRRPGRGVRKKRRSTRRYGAVTSRNRAR